MPKEKGPDLKKFMGWMDNPDQPPDFKYKNTWFIETAMPLLRAHALWKVGYKLEAVNYLKTTTHDIAPDWKAAAIAWFERRLARMSMKKEEAVNG